MYNGFICFTGTRTRGIGHILRVLRVLQQYKPDCLVVSAYVYVSNYHSFCCDYLVLALCLPGSVPSIVPWYILTPAAVFAFSVQYTHSIRYPLAYLTAVNIPQCSYVVALLYIAVYGN